MTSVDEKEKGAAAWAASDYPLAITHFTNAIEIGGDKDFLKLNKLSEAVADATKCIELDGNWAKGYSRKGDALYKSRKYTDAFNAYNSAKRISPADESLAPKCELAMKQIRIEADRAAGTSSASAPNARTPAVPVPAAPTGRLGKVVTYSRYLLLLCGVLYLLPFGRNFSSICFRSFAVLEILIGMLTLYSRFGFPKFNIEFASRVIQDSTAIYLFLGIILIMSRPYMFAMAPILLVELSALSEPLFEACRKDVGVLAAQVQPYLVRFMPSAADLELSALFTPSKEEEFKTALARNAAVCEVLQGVFLIVELILPTRNLTMMFLWWQYLQMRFMMDQKGHVKAAFASLDSQISSVIRHRLCPKVVGRGYDLLRKFLADKVKPPQAAAGPPPSISSMFSNLKSKCSVM